MITRQRLGAAAIFVVFVAATIARGTGTFLFDAAHYWDATRALVGSLDAFPDGYWELRGVLTPFVYAPAAAVTRIVGDEYAALAVLLQNSLVFAAAAVFLVPAVVRIWRPVTMAMRGVGAALVWAVTSGFAAYPLMDVYPALAIIGLLLLVRTHRPWVFAVAGLIAGIAVNIRPAYLISVLLVIIVVAVWRRLSALLFTAGVVVALIPQVILNLILSRTVSPFPAGSDELVALQASYASYVVRYDTMINDGNARQFFCSPDMARRIGDSPPQSAGELAITFLQELPSSLWFSLEKITASLMWHVGVPYSAPVRPMDVAYGIGITVIAVVGVIALSFIATRRSTAKRDRFDFALITAIVGGTALSLVSSATETRFALILVLMGVMGLVAAAGAPLIETWREGRWWILAAAVTAAAALTVAAIGLSHPAPRGDVTPAICSIQ